MSDLVHDLDLSGGAAGRTLQRRAARGAALRAWVAGAAWMLFVPSFALLLHLVQRAAGAGALAFGAVEILAVALVPVLAWALFVLVRDAVRAGDVRTGLARLDREMRAEGRLQAAHEFLGRTEQSSFMAAAIDDARGHAERALAHRLAADARRRVPARAYAAPLGALLLSVLAGLAAPAADAGEGGPVAGGPGQAVPREVVAKRERADLPAPEPPPARKPGSNDARKQSETAASKKHEPARPSELDRNTRESAGKTGEGQAANATPMSSSGDSRGLQSTQAPTTEKPETGKPPQKKPKPPKKEADQKPPKKKLEQSGSTAGKGVGTGSSKNPGATEWQSKDQVSTDEEQPLYDEPQIDDDTDESEARGGLQPSLRDRRPAVNRDLSIGFGNQSPPDANGRGGPSEQKKSRGVASLVLGVPIPDHVKGQPNPGRVKITQERVDPRADDAVPIDAALRSERAAPIGSMRRSELAPWMRELVRNYFTKIRT